MMQDRTGNTSQFSLSASLPTCLTGNLSLSDLYVSTGNLSLSLHTNLPVHYEISGDVADVITGYFASDGEISFQLSAGTGEKHFTRSLFSTGNKLII